MSKQKLIYPMIVTEYDNEVTVEYTFGGGMTIVTGADTLYDALEDAKKMLEFSLSTLYEQQKEFPVVTKEQIKDFIATKDDNQSINYLTTTLEDVIRNYGTEPVKKTISIPLYMDSLIGARNISLSKYVQSKIEQDFFAT